MNMPSRGLVAAGAAFAACALVLGSAVLRATSAPPIMLEYTTSPAEPVPGAALTEDMAAESLVHVLDADPFQPDRQRPPQRYRLPGDVDPPPPPPPPPPPVIPEFRVSGTAVTPQGGLAVMRIGEGVTRVVAHGDFLGGYQLHLVTPDGVVMKNDEREVSVRVSMPSAQVAAAPPGPPARPAAQAGRAEQLRQQAAQQQRQQQLTPEQAQRLAEILERARVDGASPQMLQALQQMIQQRGIDTFMNTDIVIDGNTMRTMQRGPPGGGQQERN